MVAMETAQNAHVLRDVSHAKVQQQEETMLRVHAVEELCTDRDKGTSAGDALVWWLAKLKQNLSQAHRAAAQS